MPSKSISYHIPRGSIVKQFPMTTRNKKNAGPRKSGNHNRRRSGSLDKLEFFELIKEQNTKLAEAYNTVRNMDKNRVSRPIPELKFNFDEKVMGEMERTTLK